MRSIHLAIGLLLLGPLVGCETLSIFNPKPPEAPMPTTTPSVESLVGYLNDNANRIQSIRCTDVDITASRGIQSFGLRGKMMAMKSRNFYLSATAFGSPAVDLGSNSEEFWFWMSKGEPPHQFFCSYRDYEAGRVRQLPFPFQPEWIMEAMGMGPYGPADKFTLETDAKTLRLVEKTRTPQGNPIRKVIVLNRRPVQAPSPQILAFLLIDDTDGKEIASANIQDIQIDSATGALLPRRMDLRWPAQNAKLALVFNGLNVNPQLDVASFQRQPLRDVPSINLATMQPDSIQRAQGFGK